MPLALSRFQSFFSIQSIPHSISHSLRNSSISTVIISHTCLQFINHTRLYQDGTIFHKEFNLFFSGNTRLVITSSPSLIKSSVCDTSRSNFTDILSLEKSIFPLYMPGNFSCALTPEFLRSTVLPFRKTSDRSILCHRNRCDTIYHNNCMSTDSVSALPHLSCVLLSAPAQPGVHSKTDTSPEK